MATVVDHWVHAGDVAELTFTNGETIRGIYTLPPGGPPGWVLADGCRIGTRPRTLERITIVYPPEHTTEDVDHD